ncbi:hypothetical protein BJ912DRAFT_961718 [Pholiota molesta]|nr:hypothetical protein BJ912DRAFT_961718 [Pholiota molesta]
MGLAYSMYTESFPPKSKFSASDIPDLSGKVMIVTGGNAAYKAIDELEKETGKKALFLQLDLSDLKSIKAAAQEFSTRRRSFTGVMIPPIDQLTAQGYDLQFGTNVLGHFYFTKLLSGWQGARRKHSSSASLFANKIDYDTLGDTPARKKKGPAQLYMQSKFVWQCTANEFARRYGDHIVSTSLNPGNIRSELQRNMSRAQYFFVNMVLWDTSYGALTQLWAGTSPEGVDLNGQYLIPWARVGTGNKAAKDPKLAQELWDWLEEQTQKFENSNA